MAGQQTITSAFQSPTFERDVTIHVNETVGSASISPSGRDVVLASYVHTMMSLLKVSRCAYWGACLQEPCHRDTPDPGYSVTL